jgi:hypothetical protein
MSRINRQATCHLRTEIIAKWHAFVLLHGLLPLSISKAQARDGWVAFRDELLQPQALAPHDWVCLKRFSLPT